MAMRSVLSLMILLAGCGRIGFDALGGGNGGDDTIPDGDGGNGDGSTAAGCKIGNEVVVAPGTTEAWEAQLLWNGTRLGIAWSEAMGEFEIMFALANADGVPGTAQNISNAAEHSWFPSLAWSGSEFGVTWSDDRLGDNDVRFARINATTGARIGNDLAITTTSGDGWFPTIAWDNDEYQIVWADDAVANFDIWRAAVNGAGAITTAAFREETTAGAWAPVVAWTGTALVTAWGQDGTRSVHARFRGAANFTTPLVTSTGQASIPSIVPLGNSVAIAWQDTRDGTSQVYVALYDLAGNRIGAEHRISTVGPAGDPALVSNGTGFGIAWEDRRTGTNEIYFAELDASGARKGNETPVTPGTPSTNPALAWVGTHFVVAYDGPRNRVDADIYTRTVCIP